MKSFLLLFIFLFISFLSLPTIVLWIDKDKIDISMAFNMSEEEEVLTKSSIKVFINTKKNIIYICPKAFESKLIFSSPDDKYVSVLDEIFSPPPEI